MFILQGSASLFWIASSKGNVQVIKSLMKSKGVNINQPNEVRSIHFVCMCVCVCVYEHFCDSIVQIEIYNVQKLYGLCYVVGGSNGRNYICIIV